MKSAKKATQVQNSQKLKRAPKLKGIPASEQNLAPLGVFQNNNPHAHYDDDKKFHFINKPWGRDDCRLKIDKTDNDFINDLNSLQLNPRLDAIVHLQTDTIEFVYTYLDPEEETEKSFIDRSFVFYLNGCKCECKFAEPSKQLMKIAKYFERLPSSNPISLFQIDPFKDIQDLDDANPWKLEFFKNRVPRNFFIKFDKKIASLEVINFVNHANFLLRYYDRSSPIITINPDAPQSEALYNPRLRYINSDFPQNLSINNIDPFILKLLEVAERTHERFAFIYYYQVLEYAAHHYIDTNARALVKRLLKDPAIIDCDSEKFGEIFSVLTDLNHNDETRIRKIVEEYCDPAVIWKEVENNKKFFASEQRFEGGYNLASLLSENTDLVSWKSMWTPKLFDTLTKIRNVLVHAREKRENKTIHPTDSNDLILAQYLPLIKRVAEQVAIKAAD